MAKLPRLLTFDDLQRAFYTAVNRRRRRNAPREHSISCFSQKSTIAFVVGILSIVAVSTSCSQTPAQPSASGGVAQLGAPADRLLQLEPFVQQAADRTETFDEAQARSGGADEAAIHLGRELVALNNRVVSAATSGHEYDGGIEQYSQLNAAFLEMAQQGLNGQARLWSGCGSPLFPSACPARVNSNRNFSSDPKVREALTGAGYHYTASYAGQSGNDYTMTVSNSCWPSSFRSQAIVTKAGSQWTYSTQSPEPNPEILSYIWPYTWWGGYVWFWHRYYC